MEQISDERGTVLTRDTYYQLVHTLWRALPPPVSDDPEDLVRRNRAAMAEVASMLPADPTEAALAGQFVVACAHAVDCLRLVTEHAAEPKLAMKCRAQAASMMRQACSARSLLMRVQEVRRKRVARGSAADEPAWIDHGILDRMTEALKRASAPAPKAGAECATTQTFSHARAASAPTTALAEHVMLAQAVSSTETKSESRANETPARPDQSASPIGDTPDSPTRPHTTSRQANHPNEQPEAPSGRGSAGFAPSKRDLPASDAVTDAMNRTPRPAEPMPRAA